MFFSVFQKERCAVLSLQVLWLELCLFAYVSWLNFLLQSSSWCLCCCVSDKQAKTTTPKTFSCSSSTCQNHEEAQLSWLSHTCIAVLCPSCRIWPEDNHFKPLYALQLYPNLQIVLGDLKWLCNFCFISSSVWQGDFYLLMLQFK